MSAAVIVALVICASLVTAGASYLVFKAMGVEIRRRHLEVGTAIFLQLGVIYAVFLAFVFGQALSSYVAADDAIDTECAALHGAAMLAIALPAPVSAQIAEAIDKYLSSILDSEWPAMRATRHSSEATREAEEKMIRLVNGLDLSDAKDVRVQTQIVSVLMDGHKSREERIFEAGQGIPLGLWAMILVYCSILVGLVFFSSLEYAASHAVLSGIFGGLNALVLLAVFALQYPFEGPFRLSPESFVLTKARVSSTFASGSPPR